MTGRRRQLVRVVVPCHRYAHWLVGCVVSALDQPGVDVQVLIVDDCSPDHTTSVAARLAEADRRVSYRRNAVNRGLIATANDSLEWAWDSDCNVLLSADDLLVRGSLARAATVLADVPQVGMVYGQAPYVRPDRSLPSVRGRWRSTRVWPGADWVRRRCATGHNCISSPELVARSALHRRVGGYDPACVHASDLNLWLRLAAVSEVARIRGVPQAIYRVHSDSMLRSDPDPLLDLRERRAAFDRFFASPQAGALPDAAELAALAGRALARQALWRASRTVERGSPGTGAEGVPGAERAWGAGSSVDALVAFALDVCPDARRLREWHGLRARRWIGPDRPLWRAPFLATGAAHRARGHMQRTWGAAYGG